MFCLSDQILNNFAKRPQVTHVLKSNEKENNGTSRVFHCRALLRVLVFSLLPVIVNYKESPVSHMTVVQHSYMLHIKPLNDFK